MKHIWKKCLPEYYQAVRKRTKTFEIRKDDSDYEVGDILELLKEQEAKTGHWIEKEDYAFDTYYDCSVCGESWSTIEGTPWENGMNYCPHCGAKMEGR